MKIVKIHGGLGNQMFQYALYRSLKKIYNDIIVDITEFEDYEYHNGFELSKIFRLEFEEASKKECLYFSDKKRTLPSKIRRKILGRRKSYVKEELYNIEKISLLKNFYLEGYWQSETFFKNVVKEIREDFTFPEMSNQQNKDILKIIESSESVSLHVRRGDYITDLKVFELYGKICDLEYYTKAIKEITNRVNNPHFFVFSNDMDWVKENLKIDAPVNFVDWNTGSESYMDMNLISRCKNNIICNSSFSWWGAWLNRNKNRIVISPGRWKVDFDMTKNRIPREWIKI